MFESSWLQFPPKEHKISLHNQKKHRVLDASFFVSQKPRDSRVVQKRLCHKEDVLLSQRCGNEKIGEQSDQNTEQKRGQDRLRRFGKQIRSE